MSKQTAPDRKSFIVPAIILLALLLRGFFLNRFLEYDEIWTLQNYAKLGILEIFQDLATPNNHPVNSFIVKLISGFSTAFWSLRLGALLFSLGAIIVYKAAVLP